MIQNKKEFKKYIEQLAIESVLLDASDIPKLGEILKIIGSGIEQCNDVPGSTSETLLLAMKQYIEKMVLKKVDDTAPFEEAVKCLQSSVDDNVHEYEIEQDISLLLKKLKYEIKETPKKASRNLSNKDEITKIEKHNLTEEDKKILFEFVNEAIENLETIEVNLIHLEENPDDPQLINEIFRPFHTIKGVSGFLKLKKINLLSHSVENLLDKARDGEIKVDEIVVDIILEAVDLLNKMLNQVEIGLQKNQALETEEHEINILLEHIEKLNINIEKIGNKRIGEIMIQRGDLPEDIIENVLQEQKRTPDKKIGEILFEKGKLGSKQVIAALREQRRFGKKQSEFHVKVDTGKLDTLVDMTGELVIAHSMMKRDIEKISENNQKLTKNINQIYQITSLLQKTAMSMRMVPIKNTFHKMLRLVRELNKVSGKNIGINIIGSDTEIDRNLVDELYEPLVHMIRNAIDHGIEDPEVREKAGKVSQGVIELRAHHRGGNVVIEVFDDGKGLDKKKIIQKALALNIVQNTDDMKDTDIYNLIFHPGFTTAQKVTEISGRGVGMDVVKKSIEKLRGRIEIVTNPGEGTTYIIRVPLTLAIIDGIIVGVGNERFIVPTLSILESFVPRKEQYLTVHDKSEMIYHRDGLAPLIRLDKIFGCQNKCVHPWEGLVMAVEHDGEKRYLLLDELMGKEEVVIKSLGEKLKNIRCVAGCSIIGDGKVALILDIPDLIEYTRGEQEQINDELVMP
nr:chemotaxis protein CheA [uncultured bacterium]